jgi:hypothetical protein
MLEDMKSKGVMEESVLGHCRWCSPGRNTAAFTCVDYRRPNDVTKDCIPLPRIDNTLDTLAGAQCFYTLDLKSGYWQVALHPEDKDETAFPTGQGLRQFTVLPFELCNAPATFERLMESVLRGMNYEASLVYLDDVTVIDRTFQ